MSPTSDQDRTEEELLAVTFTSEPDIRALAQWDRLVTLRPGSDVAQLSAWAEVRRTAGFYPHYVYVWHGADMIGGALLMGRKLPFIGEVGYVPYGPVISEGADRNAVIRVLAAAFVDLARRTARVLFIQPPADSDDISLELQRRGFRPSNAGIAPAASLRLDLSRDEDQLRAGLRKRLRTWTRSWPKRGVHVRRGTAEDMPRFAQMHAATAEHQGFEPLPAEYLAKLYSQLARGGHAELFVGEIEGRPVAARFYSSCGGVLKLRFAGMDRNDEAARLSVPAAVEWSAILWAKANGYRWFDFGGIEESSVAIIETGGYEAPGLRSIDSFKATFGGTPFRYPTAVEIISPSIVRVAYDVGRRWTLGRSVIDRTRLLIGGRATTGRTSQPK